MASLETSVDGLERSFRQIQHDLSCAAHRLDVAFDEASARDGAPHPLKIMRRLQALEERAGKVATQWKAIQEKREEVLPKLVEGLTSNTQDLSRLSRQAGCMGTEYEEESSGCLSQLQIAAGVEVTAGAENVDPQQYEGGDVPAKKKKQGRQEGEVEAQEGAGEKPKAKPKAGGKKGAAAAAGAGAGAGGVTKEPAAELTEERFEALEASVRGRVKFATAVKAYAIMDDLFTKYNIKNMRGAPTEHVPLKAIHEAGANVHGRSGEALLASLRTLGLITVGKQGVALTKPVPQAAPKKGKPRR